MGVGGTSKSPPNPREQLPLRVHSGPQHEGDLFSFFVLSSPSPLPPCPPLPFLFHLSFWVLTFFHFVPLLLFHFFPRLPPFPGVISFIPPPPDPAVYSVSLDLSVFICKIIMCVSRRCEKGSAVRCSVDPRDGERCGVEGSRCHPAALCRNPHTGR